MTVTQQAPTMDETRDRILAEAERLFRHYGYAKTTVADIASVCGMSPSNVYRFFASKGAINEAICSRIIVDSEVPLRAIVKSGDSASDRLSSFVMEMHRFTAEALIDQNKVHEMVVAAIEEQWETIRQHLDRVRVMIGEIIQSGIRSGEFRDQDADQAARCVLTATAALKHPVLLAQCGNDPHRAAPEELVAFILSALKA